MSSRDRAFEEEIMREFEHISQTVIDPTINPNISKARLNKLQRIIDYLEENDNYIEVRPPRPAPPVFRKKDESNTLKWILKNTNTHDSTPKTRRTPDQALQDQLLIKDLAKVKQSDLPTTSEKSTIQISKSNQIQTKTEETKSHIKLQEVDEQILAIDKEIQAAKKTKSKIEKLQKSNPSNFQQNQKKHSPSKDKMDPIQSKQDPVQYQQSAMKKLESNSSEVKEKARKETEEKIRQVKKLKAQLLSEVASIVQKVKNLKKLIKDNQWDSEENTGCFTVDFSQFFQSLEGIDESKDMLNVIMELQVSHWEERAKKKLKDEDKKKQKLKAFMMEQERKLAAILAEEGDDGE